MVRMSGKEKKENIILVRKLSPLNVWALAFGCIIGFGCFVLPANTFLPNAGPLGTALAISLCAFIMMIIAINYDYMIRIHPVSGGEFAYAEKIFGRKHSFCCAWFLGLSYGTLVPMNATALALISRSLLAGVFKIGVHYVLAGYDVYLGEVILAIVAIIALGILNICGVKIIGVFQVMLTFALVLGVVILTVCAIVNGRFNVDSLSPLFPSEKDKISGMASVMAIAPFLFVGFDTVPQSAEEFNFSSKKTKVIMIASILFGAMVYIIINTITASVVPAGYKSWVEYIDASNMLEGIASLPTFYVAQEMMGPFGLFCIGIAVIGATLSGMVGFYMATSRLLYSMANERVLPSIFGRLHATYKTPYVAILFVMALSVVAPLFGRVVLGWLVDMSSLGAAIGYGYTSMGVLYYAKKSKDIIYMLTGAIGVALSLCFAILLLVPIPGLNCSLCRESQICLVIWIAIGLIFYFKSQQKNN